MAARPGTELLECGVHSRTSTRGGAADAALSALELLRFRLRS